MIGIHLGLGWHPVLGAELCAVVFDAVSWGSPEDL